MKTRFKLRENETTHEENDDVLLAIEKITGELKSVGVTYNLKVEELKMEIERLKRGH